MSVNTEETCEKIILITELIDSNSKRISELEYDNTKLRKRISELEDKFHCKDKFHCCKCGYRVNNPDDICGHGVADGRCCICDLCRKELEDDEEDDEEEEEEYTCDRCERIVGTDCLFGECQKCNLIMCDDCEGVIDEDDGETYCNNCHMAKEDDEDDEE
jgi:hypothetical protein